MIVATRFYRNLVLSVDTAQLNCADGEEEPKRKKKTIEQKERRNDNLNDLHFDFYRNQQNYNHV